MSTLVVGLGNPILGDDGAGWRIAEAVACRLPIQSGCVTEAGQSYSPEDQSVSVECLGVGGLSLMEHMIGYDRAILVDTILTGKHATGTVYCFPLHELPDLKTGHLSSTHDTTLQNALQVGQSMGAVLPDEITIVAVEARCVYDFSDELTPPVATAVPIAVKMIMELLK